MRSGLKRPCSRCWRMTTSGFGPPPPEAVPGVVAEVADHRLHDEPGERGREPEHRDLVGLCAQVLVDGAHVGHLQPPAELDAQEAKAHVPDCRELRLG